MNVSLAVRFTKFCLLLVLVASAHAATLTVTSTADAGGTCPGTDCTLRQAIAAAFSGDTINFSLPSNSAVTLTSAELLITKSLTINGPGANLLSVQRSTASNIPNFRIFNIASGKNVTISGLTVTNGSITNDSGGGIANNGGTLTLTNATVSANTALGAGYGGGIFNNVGTVTIADCTVSGNSGYDGGAIYNSTTGSLTTINNSTISGNMGAVAGGVFNESGIVTITNSTIVLNSGNPAYDIGGGGVLNDSGTVNAKNTIIARNTAPAGGDVAGTLTSQGYNIIGDTTGATITGTTTGNQLNVNPNIGPLQDNGGPTTTHALLSGSTAIDAGSSSGSNTDQRGLPRPVVAAGTTLPSGGDGSDIGAYEVQADQLPGCKDVVTVVSNNSDAGMASLRDVIGNVCAGSTITFASNVRGAINLTSGELLINKSLTVSGPGANLLSVQRSASASTSFRVFNIADHLNVAISGLTIANGNRAGNFGGGIYNNNSALTLTSVAVSGNTAALGGGIYTARALTVSNSTISGNTITGNVAGDGGGGIGNTGGTVSLTNCTISGNFAQVTGGGGYGGGIYNNLGTVTLTNSTISGNTGDVGGGVTNTNNGTVNSKNTIIALNTSPSGPDVNGALTSQGFNLIGNASSPAVVTPTQFSDQLGVSAAQLALGPLQDNGGPTLTQALGSGSFALDKGTSSGSNADQRGLPRPSDDPSISNASGGDGSDIGAFELQVPAPTPTPVPSATPTATPPSQLLNLSTRKQVGAGDNVLIGGFIVVGTEDKKVLLRGLGPSLPVGSPLADPTLELHASDTTLLAFDDNWRDKQADEINATGIPPSNDLEAAIVTTLGVKPAANGGAGYTAVLAGSGGGTGIGLLEIYDLNAAANSKLANISTRGFVGVDPDLLIGGFIPGPSDRAPIKVLVRALGPSLTSQGVGGALQDPVLELHDGNGTLLTNDNWKDASNAAEIQATLPPPDERESAIITTLAPSNSGYTAVVRGANGTTGVALVEVYSLQ